MKSTETLASGLVRRGGVGIGTAPLDEGTDGVSSKALGGVGIGTVPLADG